jgi:hypothetical protein
MYSPVLVSGNRCTEQPAADTSATALANAGFSVRTMPSVAVAILDPEEFGCWYCRAALLALYGCLVRECWCPY